jgi:ABC-type Fe3+/spermidine/putrescine transport system ATPase subunit
MGSELLVTARVKGRLEVEQLTVPPGVTVLFGPSGAGKSTCLSVIAGLLEPDSGEVKLGELELSRLPAHRRHVALVFQSLALFPHLDALGNVAYGAPSRDEAMKWLERMRVQHAAARRPAQLSGGEAQRVALARALASQPRVLLLDEPFSAMDQKLKRELGDELLQWVGVLALPTLLVTHDREDAVAFGSRVVMLEQGRITRTGSPAELPFTVP